MSDLSKKAGPKRVPSPPRPKVSVRRGGAAERLASADAEGPATLRRPDRPGQPGAPRPAPPGIEQGPDPSSDPADWTLNTPAIKVAPAELTEQNGLNGTAPPAEASQPGGFAPPAEASQPGVLAPPAEASQPGVFAPPAEGSQPGVFAPPAEASQPGVSPPLAGGVDGITLPRVSDEGAAITPSEERGRSADAYIGSTIGDRYVIDEVLGEGGMGRVYLAHHKVIDKKLAIKILHSEFVKDQEAVGRFLREAKAASSIGNPHIVDISDFGETPDGSTYFVMEHLDGNTLGDLIDERGALPMDLILDISLQLIDGLAAAHAQEIVHRDLKPENVTLVSRGNQSHFCKILDFGIAKVSSGVTNEKLTLAGAVFGTPHYMSPEQAAGATVDHRTDIYSLGVMMYEMASGQLPFNADNFMGILTQHMYRAPVPIRALVPAPKCPPGLEAVILKCLSKKPDARYASMPEFAADLQRLKAGQIPEAVHEMMARSGSFNVPADYFKKGDAVVPATPPGMQRRAGPRIAWIAAAVISVTVVLGVILYDRMSTAQPPPAADRAGAPTAPADPGATATAAPTDDEPTSTQVLLAAEPVDAVAWMDGIRIELPASIPVPVGQKVSLDIKLEGYEPQSITLDGSEQRKTVKLDKKPGAPRIIRRPRPKPGGKGKSGSSEVVDPWAK